MTVEHFGKYQLEFIPLELAGIRRWAAYLAIHKFDEDKQDFVCILEKHRVSDSEFSTEEEATNEARKAGNALIKSGNL